jgi:hypothetical protein
MIAKKPRVCGCGEIIPEARLRALPKTTTCVNCSEEEKVAGHTYWDGKHTPVLQVMSKSKAQEFAKKERFGFHANVPTESYNSPFALNAVKGQNLSLDIKEVPAWDRSTVAVNTPMARCHPKRPAVTAKSGLCTECALEWYQKRKTR